ncbi:MAG TPA: hypothetical protein VF970_16995 [Gemmatimonadales bacterium]
MMTDVEATAVLAIPLRQLRRYLRDGVIRGERRGDTWCIDGAEVERVRQAREQAIEAIAPELAAAEELVAAIGTVRGRAMRDAVGHATEILRLAAAWEQRAHGGAEAVMSGELADTMARHIAAIERISSALRGTAATYTALLDHLGGLARLTDTAHQQETV